MILILIIIVGLVLGSFLNVVIYRLHKGTGFMRGRSYCPHCKHSLGSSDLIPLFSFVFLRGKCRYCSRPISWQYPLVEAVTALSFAVLYIQYGLVPTFFVYALYTCFLIVIFVYDLRYYLILDKVSVPAMVVAVFFSLFILEVPAWHLLFGSLIGGCFFLVQFLVSKGKWVGGGDIRLGIVMGLMLGYQQLFVALFLAYVLGSIVGIGLVLSGKRKMNSHVPFGTFLSLATFLTFIVGDLVISYYKSLLWV